MDGLSIYLGFAEAGLGWARVAPAGAVADLTKMTAGSGWHAGGRSLIDMPWIVNCG
jgi:hypothetical protein